MLTEVSRFDIVDISLCLDVSEAIVVRSLNFSTKMPHVIEILVFLIETVVVSSNSSIVSITLFKSSTIAIVISLTETYVVVNPNCVVLISFVVDCVFVDSTI